jgi:DNA-binding NarL/FixJ family response regulator
MTRDQIDEVLGRVQSWPKNRQEDAARLLLAMEAQNAAPYILSDEERADLEAALDEVAKGDIASDAEVAAVFARRSG